MARDGLFALLCACGVFLIGPMRPALTAPGDDREAVVAAALAVQSAMEQARSDLQHGDCRAAVRVLEEHLPKINGNATYLALLRDAYRGYICNLKAARQDAEAQRYLQRLQILDPGAVLDLSGAAPKPEPALNKITPRGVMEDPNGDPKASRVKALTLLQQAEEAFTQKKYREAAGFFELASQADAETVASSRERWAYCRLEHVADQLNHPAAGSTHLGDLEKETRRALDMTPAANKSLQDFGGALLAEIDKRQNASTPVKVSVTHRERDKSGWAVAETANFRIFHNQSRELAEQVAQVAEHTRTTMAKKWFGGFKDNWSPRCDIYLHATAQDYSKATGVPNGSPGHSSFKTDAGRVLSRQIDLHCDDPKNMLAAVLPHEATHVVLAGQFGDQPIPRWADEGIAVLTEPREKIDRHLRNLMRSKEDGGLYRVKDLMQLNDYPEPKYITVFYAQSVSLVEFLATRDGGPEALTKFLRSAQKDGYEAALKQHYGYKNFDELQRDWNARAFAGAAVSPMTGVARGDR
jgi:hypothetical protein